MKIIVAGSRKFRNYELLTAKLDYYLRNLEQVVIVSGGCTGTDYLGERYAKEKGYALRQFPVSYDDWKRLGKRAGPIRNKEMALYADALVAFYNGSKGTKNMIETARKHNLLVRVVKI